MKLNDDYRGGTPDEPHPLLAYLVAEVRADIARQKRDGRAQLARLRELPPDSPEARHRRADLREARHTLARSRHVLRSLLAGHTVIALGTTRSR